MKKRYIYQEGQTHAQTTTSITSTGEWADFSAESDPKTGEWGPNKPASVYLEELNAERGPGSPEFKILEWEELSPLLDAAENAKYLEPWQEICREEYWHYLEALPPQKWERWPGGSIFRMSEYYTSDITGHFAQIGERYFAGRFRTSGKTYAEHVADLEQMPVLEMKPHRITFEPENGASGETYSVFVTAMNPRHAAWLTLYCEDAPHRSKYGSKHTVEAL